MSDYEIKEALQLRQQRFDAVLAFMTRKTWKCSEFSTLTLYEAVEAADELIAKLEEATIVDENTKF